MRLAKNAISGAIAGVAGAALLLLAGCGTVPPAPKPVADAPIPVTLASAAPASGDSSLAISGTVRLKRETPLGFNTAGRIAAILVREGDAVSRGQVIARLDPTSLDAAAVSARAEAVRADADYRRLNGLFAQGWVTAPRVETARATAAAARARVAQSGFDVGLASIRAPSAGVVLRRSAEPGQIISPGQVILTVGERNSGYVLRVPLADSDLARVKRGQMAAVLIPALGGEAIAASISEIGARGDDATGTFRVELALPARPDMRSGLIGTARLRLDDNARLRLDDNARLRLDDNARLRAGDMPPGGGTVSIPATAIFAARADEGFVYVYDDATGRVRLRQVALGALGDGAVTITGGLHPGEKVVTSGVDRLRDGAAVRIAPARG